MNIILNDFHHLVHKYAYLIKNETNISEDSPIWVMWFQGIKNAPPIVKACIQSIIINSNKHPVYIISKDNYKKYISLPLFIEKKLEKKKFSITHFSDIIRMALLSKYGGYWIDSTYLITSPIPPTNSSLFTLKLAQCIPTFTRCLWAGNFLATSKNSFLATYAYNALLFYWKNYNTLINYFLIDYVIYVAFRNVLPLRKKIFKLPFITCNIFNLVRVLNKNYKDSLINCTFNKLSIHLKFKIKKSNKTVYGRIISKYKLRLKN